MFLTLVLDGSEWSASCPCKSIPDKRTPGAHWRGEWVGFRANLDVMA